MNKQELLPGITYLLPHHPRALLALFPDPMSPAWHTSRGGVYDLTRRSQQGSCTSVEAELQKGLITYQSESQM